MDSAVWKVQCRVNCFGGSRTCKMCWFFSYIRGHRYALGLLGGADERVLLF